MSLQRGYDITKEQQSPGVIPVVSSGGVFSYHNTAMVRGPGVVLGRKSNSIGRCYFVTTDYWPHDTTLWVKDFHGNDPRFVYYFLRNLYPRLVVLDVGSANPTLNRNHIHPMPIIWPPVAEQRAISSILRTVDDKIDLNRRMNETLEAIARALFRSWFVDFDPVRAKEEGRHPPGLDAATAALFPATFCDSSLGRIPYDWEVVQLEALAEIRGGKQLPTEECLASGNTPVFGANGIMGYAMKPTHAGFVIAFGRVGAYCGSIHWSLGGAWINNNASAVVPIRWPEYVLQSMLNIDFDSMRTGSAQPFIPNSSLASAQVLCPSAQVAEAYCRIVEPLRRQQADNESQSHTLATLRDALLPKLLSGEIRVKDVGAALPEAALIQ